MCKKNRVYWREGIVYHNCLLWEKRLDIKIIGTRESE